MYVLGLAGGLSPEYEDNALPTYGGHDAAAALVRDGQVLAAIEEERLSRIKHSNFFPTRSTAFCLHHARITPEQLDAVAFGFSEVFADDFAARAHLGDPSCPAPPPAAPSGRSHFGRLIQRCTGIDVTDALFFCGHHLAHAWSVYYQSPYARSLVLVLDGVGEDGPGRQASGLVAVGEGAQLETLKTFGVEQSLGFFYQRLIEVVGFSIFEEYKAMAMASYGQEATYRALFSSMFELLPDGGYRLASMPEQMSLLRGAGLIGGARRRGGAIERAHQDFAAGLQHTLETIVLHVLSHYVHATGCRNLCVAGGVGLNSALNGKILRSALVDDTRFHPAAHDAGLALGAAYAAVAKARGRPAPSDIGPVSWGGRCPSGSELVTTLDAWGPLITHTGTGGGADELAVRLARSEVLGWVQGRSEFGPRALGHRSVLADPRSAAIRDRVNADVKGREGFRPLAPVVLEDEARAYFELPGAATDYGHMNVVVTVKPSARSLLEGVTHVDGTARIQLASRARSPELCALLEAFKRQTGLPILINTSLNRAGEPIVESVDDAIACLCNSALDALVVEGRLVERRRSVVFADAIKSLVIGLAPYKKLVRRFRRFAETPAPYRFAIESTATRYFDDVRVDLSGGVFDLLLAADGQSTIGALLRSCGVSDPAWSSCAVEVAQLWRQRAIMINPAGQPPPEWGRGDRC